MEKQYLHCAYPAAWPLTRATAQDVMSATDTFILDTFGQTYELKYNGTK